MSLALADVLGSAPQSKSVPVVSDHDEATMAGRPKASLVLNEAERGQLVALTLRRKTAQALALRARIVLGCADGADN
jgi:phage head maturation protease